MSAMRFKHRSRSLISTLARRYSNELPARPSDAKAFGKGVYDRNLTPGYFLAGGRQIEPSRPIHFGKQLLLTRSRGPFHFEHIAFEIGFVQITFNGPRENGLSTGLSKLTQIDEISGDRHPDLFLELAPGSVQGIFARFVKPFGNGPGAVVLFCPKRPPRMHQENFNGAVAGPVEDNSCASLGH